jgi:hypothetical protein
MQKIINILNAAAYWTVPQGIDHLLRIILREGINLQRKRKKISNFIKSNVILRNKHKGERCFILATGPSIREQDLSVLNGELCIAVSHFFLHKDIKLISPRYHVLAPYHPPFNFNDLEVVFSGFNEKYTEEVNYIFGYRPYDFSIYNFINNFPNYSPKKYFYVNYTNSQPLNEENYMLSSSWDISRNPFQVRTVIYTAIQLAAYMGCKKIFLVGCDHDYLLDTKRVVNHHFYKEEEGVSDVKHLSSFTTERWFEEYYFRWKQYRLMQEYLRSKDCEIYNATHGGMLDVFPRITLSEVIA